jgi:predicted methyltransferase
MRPVKFALFASLAVLAPGVALAQSASIAAAAVASPARPADDVARDGARHPAELLAFAGIKPGDRVADLMPGGGYFSRLFSVEVGAAGRVYAVVPAELAQVAPKAVDAAKAVAANPAFPNVTVEVVPAATLPLPEPVDLAWTSDNYHDLYGFFGADQALAFDKAVFRALKPGGVFIVIDHTAATGADAAAIKRLHRIDPALVKAQAMAAGFILEAESTILANPADSHADPVFAPAIRGKTDQFVFKFRKPG